MSLVRYVLYFLVQIEGEKFSIQADWPLMINVHQIPSNIAFYWLPRKTGL